MPPPLAARRARLRVYLAEMFPPAVNIPVAVASFYALSFLLQAGNGRPSLVVTGRSLAGAAFIFLLLLLLRVSDELKDLASDRLFFPHRAIPRGAVAADDVLYLFRLALAGLCILAPLSGPRGGGVACLIIGYALLMRRWFFIEERLRRSLLLSLATHNPVVPLLAMLTLAHASQDGVVGPHSPARLATLIALFWAPSLAWEVGRKIRAPVAENTYQTYSQVFGPRAAALIPIALCSAAVAGLAALRGELGLSRVGLGALSLALSLVLFAFGRFAAAPSVARSDRLRPAVEVFLALFYSSLAADLAWQRGISFGEP